MGTWPERGWSKQLSFPCWLWSSLASPSCFRIWSLLLQHFKIHFFVPIKVFVMSKSSSLSKQEQKTAHRETDDTENLLKAGWERKEERGLRKKHTLNPSFCFMADVASLKYQQETKNQNQMKGSEFRRELSVAFQQSHQQWLLSPTSPPPLRLVTRYYSGTCYQGLRIRPVAADVKRTWHVHKAGHRGWLHILKANTSQSD